MRQCRATSCSSIEFELIVAAQIVSDGWGWGWGWGKTSRAELDEHAVLDVPSAPLGDELNAP